MGQHWSEEAASILSRKVKEFGFSSHALSHDSYKSPTFIEWWGPVESLDIEVSDWGVQFPSNSKSSYIMKKLIAENILKALVV